MIATTPTVTKNSSLNDWLSLLENRHQQEIQLELTRVRQVAEILELLCPNAIVITIGGTNGKGSTVALLESIYHNAGYLVASYSSPHLLKFNDRIKINQQSITDEQLIVAFDKVEHARGLIHLTYFEMTTLAALWYFKQHSLDVIILEVGLGGRLDATNIVNSDLSIITTVDMDHEAYLGNHIEAIAYEKAGILRAEKPFIYADYSLPRSIMSQALTLEVQSYRNGHEYHYQASDNKLHFFCHKLLSSNQPITVPISSFHNNSVAAAIMASLCLQTKLPISHHQLVYGISNTLLAGRLQVFYKPCLTILDVAHNPQATCYLADHLINFYRDSKIYTVFSAFADKDIHGLVSPLRDIITCWYPAVLSGKRAASAEQLMRTLNANEVRVDLCYDNPTLAYQAAYRQVLEDISKGLPVLIVVFGSFSTVSHVLSFLSALN